MSNTDTMSYFENDWFRTYGEGTRPTPDKSLLHTYGASDYKIDGETVHIVAGVDEKQNIYVVDLWKKKASSEECIEALCDLIQEWKPLGWAEEREQIKAGMGPFIHKKLTERQLYIVRQQFPATDLNEKRLQHIRSYMALGKVYFPISKFQDIRNELMSFSDRGRASAIVNALGLLGQIIFFMSNAGLKMKYEAVHINKYKELDEFDIESLIKAYSNQIGSEKCGKSRTEILSALSILVERLKSTS